MLPGLLRRLLGPFYGGRFGNFWHRRLDYLRQNFSRNHKLHRAYEKPGLQRPQKANMQRQYRNHDCRVATDGQAFGCDRKNGGHKNRIGAQAVLWSVMTNYCLHHGIVRRWVRKAQQAAPATNNKLREIANKPGERCAMDCSQKNCRLALWRQVDGGRCTWTPYCAHRFRIAHTGWQHPVQTESHQSQGRLRLPEQCSGQKFGGRCKQSCAGLLVKR